MTRSEVLAGVTAAVLACAAIVAVLAHRPGPSVTEVVAAGAPFVAADPSPPPTSLATTSLATTSVTTTMSTTSTTSGPATTAEPPPARPVATTVAPPTTAAPATTSSTTPASRSCTAGQIQVTAVTGQTFAAAQDVKVTSTITNRSSTTCLYNGYTVRSSFADAAGHKLGGSAVVADSFHDVELTPGQGITNSASWDRRSCVDGACAAAPAGAYSVTFTWFLAGGPYEVTSAFRLS